MQIKLPQTNYEICYPKRLKKFFRSNINYCQYNSYIPYMQRAVVGNIPGEIIKLFETDKADKIKGFQNALSDISIYIRKHRKEMEKDHIGIFEREIYSPEKVKTFNKKVTEIFNKSLEGILPEGYKAELNYTDSGGFANVFRLSLLNSKDEKVMHDKTLKVYYKVLERFSFNLPYHNNCAEANFWTFLKHRVGHSLDKTQFTNHYISDMKSGYCMTDFADKDIHPVTSKFNLKKILRISSEDDENNKPLFGKIYDGGGNCKDLDFIDDKVVSGYYKKLCNRNSEKDLQLYLDILNKRIQNPKTPHRDKIIKAIQCFNNEMKKAERKYFWHQIKTNILNSIKRFFSD